MPDVTWATVDDTGISPSDEEGEAWLVLCVASANEWAFDERRKAGYSDLVSEPPNQRCRAGVAMYAKLLFATDGAVSGSAQFAALDGVTDGAVGGDMREVYRLLGLRNVRPFAVG